jgi:hypothetical protein
MVVSLSTWHARLLWRREFATRERDSDGENSVQ